MIGKSLLHAPNDPLYCYCPPGVCQAPKGFRGPCRRYSDAVKDAETEYQSWIAEPRAPRDVLDRCPDCVWLGKSICTHKKDN